MKKFYFYILFFLMGCSNKTEYSYSSQVYRQQTDSLIASIIEKDFIIHPDSLRKYLPQTAFKLSPEITHKQYYWVGSNSKDSILIKGAWKLPLDAKAFYEAANRDTSDWIISSNSIGIYKVTNDCQIMTRDNFCVHFEKPVFSPDYKKAFVKIDLIEEGKALWLEKSDKGWALTKKETTWVQ